MLNNTTLSLVEFLVALSFLLFVHELGHFLVGKLFGIHAEEFGFGYPPKLVKLFNLGGTDFTLNLIPFGAFVRFKGEMDPDEPGGLYAANKWKRLGTLLAGSFMNLLTGVTLFAIIISQTGLPQPEIVQIASVEPGTPAAEAGILPGDQIMMIEETQVDSLQIVSEITRQNLGEMVELELLRNEETMIVTLIPRLDPPEGQGAMGIVMQNPIQEIGFFRAIPAGVRLSYQQFRQLLSVPGMLIRGEVQGQDARLLSPKGIFDVYSQVREETRPAEQGQPGLAFLNIAWFFAIISVSLGFTNLLPIPALDGGRILFIIPELLTGKRIPSKYENMVHLVGYTALLILMGYVFFQDFVNPVVLP
jgi:regulator of sigma E protease